MRVETVTTVSAAVVGVLLLLASVGGAFGTQSTHDWPSSSGDWVIRLVLGEVVRGIVIIVVCNVIDVKCLRTATGQGLVLTWDEGRATGHQTWGLLKKRGVILKGLGGLALLGLHFWIAHGCSFFLLFIGRR
jgi:hypothetical protein